MIDFLSLNFVAAGIYAMIAALSLVAHSKTSELVRNLRGWLALGVFFLLLAGLRLFGLEDLIRDVGRDLLRVQGAYGTRRMIQTFFVVGGMTVAMAGVAWAYRSHFFQAASRLQLLLKIAQMASLVMLTLVAVRLVSLHSIDTLLYGPLKLNWFVDLGCALAVGVCAILSMREDHQGSGF